MAKNSLTALTHNIDTDSTLVANMMEVDHFNYFEFENNTPNPTMFIKQTTNNDPFRLNLVIPAIAIQISMDVLIIPLSTRIQTASFHVTR